MLPNQNDQRKNEWFIKVPEEMAETLAQVKLNGRQCRYIWALLRKTLRYQKDMDWVSDSQIEDLTGMGRSNVCSIKNKLTRMRILKREGKKVGINQNYEEWEGIVLDPIHVSDPKQESIEGDTKSVSKLIQKSIKGDTHIRERNRDSLTRGMTESEENLRTHLLQEMSMEDFTEPLHEQVPIISDFHMLVQKDGDEKFKRKWRRVKRLDQFRNIKKLSTLYGLYKSSSLSP